MPREKAFNDLEEVKGFFPKSSHKVVERLLKRVADKEAKQAGRDVARAMRSVGKAGGAFGKGLGRQLAKAMSHRNGGRKEGASLRQRAPDTNGRPFHFAHGVVSKGGGAAPGAGKAKSKAAAHMAYIERAGAVAAGAARGAEAEKGAVPRGRDDGSWDRGLEAGAPDIEAAMSSAKSNQRYIEDPVNSPESS